MLRRLEPLEPCVGMATDLLCITEARASRKPVEHEGQERDRGAVHRVRLGRQQAWLLPGALFLGEAAHEAIDPQCATYLEQGIDRHHVALTQRGLERDAL